MSDIIKMALTVLIADHFHRMPVLRHEEVSISVVGIMTQCFNLSKQTILSKTHVGYAAHVP